MPILSYDVRPSWTSSTGTFSSSPVVLDLSQVIPPISITLKPASGDTVTCEFSTTPDAATNPGSAIWQKWPIGDVTVTISDVRIGPVSALRFSRVSGSGTSNYEVLA